MSTCAYHRSRRPRAHAGAIPVLLALFAASAASAASAGPSTLPTGFTDTQIVGSLDQPVGLARIPNAATKSPRVLLVEQRTARVRLVVGTALSTVGTVPGVNSAANERGLLGIAVDPNFPSAPYLYVHSTDNRFGDRIAVSRFTLTGDLDYSGTGSLAFDAASRYDLIRNMPDNASNHNGGTVRFGPDGHLYVSIGDDANSCAAQQVTILAGKILRLDVGRLPPGAGGPAPYALLTPPGNPYPTNPDSGARLVWTMGLRNPFRFHIDAATGDLFVADVGQNTWEEITRFGAGGQNGGWPWLEGPDPLTSCAGSQPASIAPIAWYDHAAGVAIMSAGVYRRPASGANRFPAEYEGNCFFLDYYSGIMRRLTGTGPNWTAPPPVPGQPTASDWATGLDNVSDVLALPDGTLWYVRQSVNFSPVTGEIRRIAYPVTTDAPLATLGGISFAAPRPTPSHGRVMLAWSQPRSEPVRLVLFDAGGRALRVLEDGGVLPAGTHEREWNGTDHGGAPVSPGLYFAQLEVGGEVRRTRITLLR